MAVQRHTLPAQVGRALMHSGRVRGETKAVKIDARKQTIIMKSQDQSLPGAFSSQPPPPTTASSSHGILLQAAGE